METSLIKVFKFRLCQYFKTVNFKDFVFQFDLLLILWGFLWLAVDRKAPVFAFEYQSGIIIKLFVFFNLYVFWGTIVSGIYRICRNIPRISFDPVKKSQNWPRLDWVNISGLVDILFSKNWLPTHDLQEIWMQTKKIKKLGDNLERIWILKRWENNARILNPEISQNQILEKIMSCEDSDDLSPLLIGNWQWSRDYIKTA